MKITIIVAIYNIEKYIGKCIESILNQTFDNFELLLINDGSTDNCENICKKYIYDNRVKYFYKKNGGLSDARNYGITKATGEYLMFVDGDDYLYNDDCLKKIVEKLKGKNLDILQYKMSYFYEQTNKMIELKNIYNDKLSMDIYDNLKKFNSNGTLSISACDKIVKTEIIKNNKVYFEKGIYSEDIDWSFKVYLLAKKIDILNENIYVYRQQRKGSITNVKSKKRSEDLWLIIKKWYNYDYPNKKIKDVYYNYLAYQCLILVTIKNKNTLDKKQDIEIKNILLDLIKYNDNYKVKTYYKLSKILGINLSIIIMKFYLFFKNKGVIKL